MRQRSEKTVLVNDRLLTSNFTFLAMSKPLRIVVIDDDRDSSSIDNALCCAGINARVLDESVCQSALESQLVYAQQKLDILQSKLESHYRELEVVESLKNSLLRTISNELRSPLNIIMGYSQMLLRQYFGKLNSQQSQIVEKVFFGGKNLLRSIDRMLEIAQLEAECLPLNIQQFDLKLLVEKVILDLSHSAPGKNLTLEINSNLRDSIIESDRDRLKEIIRELIVNAIQFSDRGKISVSLKEIASGELTIAVEDGGIGIAPEHLGRIFDKFWQVDPSLERQHQSLGLGLTLVKILVEKMQGTITVDSQLGRGSTFTLALPRQILMNQNLT